jgi:ATP-binding cassette, subfamily B, bacterial
MSYFLEPLPAAVLEHLNGDVMQQERVLIRVGADLDVDLYFACRWLVVTDQRVILISSGDGTPTTELFLKEIKSVKVEGLVGGGRLILRNGDRQLGVVYFTNSALPKFAEVAAGIERLIRSGDADLPATVDRIRCESCKRLLPEKNGVCPNCIDRWATLRRLLKYVLPYRLTLIWLFAILLASTAAELVAPLTIRFIMDHIVDPGMAFSLLVWSVGILLAARLSMWLCETARGRVSVWVGGRVTADVRNVLFNRIVHFPMRSIDQWSVGKLVSRFVNDVDRLEEFMGSGAPLLMMSILLFSGIWGLLLYLSASLTAAILVPIPFIILWTWFVWKKLREAQDRQSSCLARLSTQISESLNGIRVVKVFCQEEEEYKRFLDRNDRVRITSADAEGWSLLFFTVVYFLMNIGVFLIWYIGGREVLSGALTLGSLLAAGSFLWMLYWPLQWFGQVSNSLSQALTGAVQFFELADSPVEEAAESSGLPARHIEGLVRFHNVTFGYDPGRPVLTELNFRVEPGEVIGIIGRTGTGKTTLMNLLCRFYEADRGTILIDGVDVRNYRLDDLRKQVAIVPQDIFLFNATIEDNIRYGRPDATFEEVMTAARVASAHEFILERPDGYDSLVGPGGDRLSGGERQRIAITRAILANPRILILDEATSSLDVESEAAIQKALARVSRDRTTFIIAHRLSTIRNADRLIVLDRGRIVETGTYDELLAGRGLLWKFANAYSETRDL